MLSRTAATASVWLPERMGCCEHGLLARRPGCPTQYPAHPPLRRGAPSAAVESRARNGTEASVARRKKGKAKTKQRKQKGRRKGARRSSTAEQAGKAAEE